MKRYYITNNKILICIFVCLLVFILNGCDNNKNENADIQETDSISTIDNENTLNYTIIEKAYPEITNDISLKYLQLSSNIKNYSQVNHFIKDAIQSYLEQFTVDNYEGLSLNINYKVSFMSNNLISIIFEGLQNVATAAHPTNEFFTLNIDLKENQLLELEDIVTIDDNFINVYRKSWKNQSMTEISDYLDKFSDDDLKAIFEGSNNYQFSYFFTDNQLGISLDVAHAIGDHVETMIDYDQITLNENYMF